MLAEVSDLTSIDLSLVDTVVHDLVSLGADSSQLMLVGAHCRNLWGQALGDPSPMVNTYDVDVGIAVSSMEQWSALTSRLSKMPGTSSGIAFEVAGFHVDVMPFGGAVERPRGTVAPPTRLDDPFSVLGFEAAFRSGVTLTLPSGSADIKLPTPEGYTLLKIAAFHDRQLWGETKDAQDLAVIRNWYLTSDALEERLYEDENLLPLLVDAGADPRVALMSLWGQNCAGLLLAEDGTALLRQWSDCRSRLLSVWGGEQPGRDWSQQVTVWLDAFDGGLRRP